VSERRNTEHGDIPANIFILKANMFAEYKNKVFLVVEYQSVIARDGWELKMDKVWGRETPLALAALKCNAPSEFVLYIYWNHIILGLTLLTFKNRASYI
jgi:hypothetical protein